MKLTGLVTLKTFNRQALYAYLMEIGMDALGRTLDSVDTASGKSVNAAPGQVSMNTLKRDTSIPKWVIDQVRESGMTNFKDLYSGCLREMLGDERLSGHFPCMFPVISFRVDDQYGKGSFVEYPLFLKGFVNLARNGSRERMGGIQMEAFRKRMDGFQDDETGNGARIFLDIFRTPELQGVQNIGFMSSNFSNPNRSLSLNPNAPKVISRMGIMEMMLSHKIGLLRENVNAVMALFGNREMAAWQRMYLTFETGKAGGHEVIDMDTVIMDNSDNFQDVNRSGGMQDNTAILYAAKGAFGQLVKAQCSSMGNGDGGYGKYICPGLDGTTSDSGMAAQILQGNVGDIVTRFVPAGDGNIVASGRAGSYDAEYVNDVREAMMPVQLDQERIGRISVDQTLRQNGRLNALCRILNRDVQVSDSEVVRFYMDFYRNGGHGVRFTGTYWDVLGTAPMEYITGHRDMYPGLNEYVRKYTMKASFGKNPAPSGKDGDESGEGDVKSIGSTFDARGIAESLLQYVLNKRSNGSQKLGDYNKTFSMFAVKADDNDSWFNAEGHPHDYNESYGQALVHKGVFRHFADRAGFSGTFVDFREKFRGLFFRVLDYGFEMAAHFGKDWTHGDRKFKSTVVCGKIMGLVGPQDVPSFITLTKDQLRQVFDSGFIGEWNRYRAERIGDKGQPCGDISFPENPEDINISSESVHYGDSTMGRFEMLYQRILRGCGGKDGARGHLAAQQAGDCGDGQYSCDDCGWEGKQLDRDGCCPECGNPVSFYNNMQGVSNQRKG